MHNVKEDTSCSNAGLALNMKNDNIFNKRLCIIVCILIGKNSTPQKLFQLYEWLPQAAAAGAEQASSIGLGGANAVNVQI